MRLLKLLLAMVLSLAALPCFGQTATGDILGTVFDPTGAVVAEAKVTLRSMDTNASKEDNTGGLGTFRFPLLPVGSYEVTVEKTGFAKYVQGPILLRLNQAAELHIALTLAGTTETIMVSTDAPIINTTNAEVSTSFDAKRIQELPLSTNRNLLNVAASLPGVAQISAGNSSFGSDGNNGTEGGSLQYSANGMRQRSNSFIVDGQDSYYPSTGGLLQPLNNPDIVAEVRFITNQFLPEYGRTAGSVMNVITKSGSNTYHGSLFWFHNDNHLNALTNAEKRVVPTPTRALFRIENQFGGTFGGKIIKDKTFFFVSALRWTDRRLGSGTSISGAPSDDGRRILNSVAGDRPAVRALLDNLPAGPPNGQSRTVTVSGQGYVIPLSTITGSGAQKFNDWQYSYKVDHRFNDKHVLSARYLDDDSENLGTGQLTPVGLTAIQPKKVRSASVGVSSGFSPRTLNEFRASFSRYFQSTNAENPAVAERIPSIEVPELGLNGFNAATTRTGIGLAANYPQFATLNNYQIQDSVSLIRGAHNFKTGFDFRRQEQFQFFLPLTRGRLQYSTLQRLIDDQATVGQVNAPLKGGERITYFRYYDYFFFLQDEWRLRPNFTLTYGIRYEAPGDPVHNLDVLNQKIVATNNNDPRYRLFPIPNRDKNNWAPRLGFNYRFGTSPGILSRVTGEGKLVLRGGYSRTYDVGFNNIPLNIASSFPLVLAYSVPTDPATALIPNAYATIGRIVGGAVPDISNPNILTRTLVSKDYRSPFAEQVSLQLQRELPGNWAFTLGYVGTKGTALYQTIDGNPPVATAPGVVRSTRVNPTYIVIRERCNCTSSIYHSLQTSIEKRLSKNFSMAAHYTWSSYIDGASEVFNPSVSGEIAFPQDPNDRRSERGRSTYDRPHHFALNGVFELPFMRSQKNLLGKALGGWQINGFLTFQSGAPFGVLNGADPGGVVTGNLVGTSTRPFLNTNLDLASMKVRDIQAAGGRSLFLPATVNNPIGNVGRNILRADGINRLDFGLLKTTQITEKHALQFHANFFNATNTRDWGIPEGIFTSPAFLNEGANEVSARRIQLGLRYVF